MIYLHRNLPKLIGWLDRLQREGEQLDAPPLFDLAV